MVCINSLHKTHSKPTQPKHKRAPSTLRTDANRPLNIMWNGQKLENCKHPKYLGVTLDCSITFKKHIQNCKAKVNTRNNILRKLTSSQWEQIPTL